MLLRLAAVFVVLCIGAAPAWSACQPPGASGFPAGGTRLDTQTKDSVSITGGCVDGVPIGQNTPAAGTFTNLGLPGGNITLTGNLVTGGALTTGGTVTTVGNFTTGGAFSTAGPFAATGTGPTTFAFPSVSATFTFPTTSKTLLASDNSNASMPTALVNLGLGITFDAHGAVGNGTTNDRTALQAAVTAGAGGIVYGTKGKTYTLGSQVYIPSDTTIDCRGATVQYDPTLATAINAMLWVGYAGTPTGIELAATNVIIRNCNFQSTLSNIGYSAISFQPGSNNVLITQNNFQNTAGYGLKAVAMRASRLKNIRIVDNTASDIQYFVYVDGDESQTWKTCIDILSSTTSQACSNAAAIPAAGTTTFTLDANTQANIAAGYGWGVAAINRATANLTYRLFGPYDGGADFTYDSGTGVVTFASALPTAAGTEVSLFTWNPAVQPANDMQNLVVSRNIGNRLRGAGVQINVPIRAYHRQISYQDGLRNLIVDSNRFDGAYQLEGMVAAAFYAGYPSNFAKWSQALTDAVWTKTRAAVASGTTHLFYSPRYDYTPTAQKITEDNSNNTHTVSQAFNVGATGSTTGSCSFKASERSKVRVYMETQAGNGTTADFNLATGAVISTANTGTGTGVNAGINYQGGGPPASNGNKGWYRAWVTGVLNSTAVQLVIVVEDDAGATSYAGDGTSGLYVWGCQVNAGTAPIVYIPTKSTAENAINHLLISVNGTDGFAVTNNVLGPTAGQCIHLEDSAANGSIMGNSCRDSGASSYYQSDSKSIIWKGNTSYNSYFGCMSIDSYNPAPPAILGSDPVSQNADVTIEGNKCDLNNNPSADQGYFITHGEGPLKIRLSDNDAINVPPGALAYKFGKTGKVNGSFRFIGEPAENLLINPSFDFDQVNEGGNYTGTGASMDGWKRSITTTATGVTFAKASASPPTGGANYGIVTIGTGDATVNATDLINIRQLITGDRWAGTKFGTAEALPLSLSWREMCSLDVTKGVAIQNAALNRSFVHTYTLPAGVWQDRYLVIPGDTAGTWVLTGASAAASVGFTMEAGVNLRSATLDQWVAGNYLTGSSQTQISQTTGAACSITDVNLQLAPVPTNIKRRPAQAELVLLQGFFEKTFEQGTAVGQNRGLVGALCSLAHVAGALPEVNWRFKVSKNTVPTVTTANPSAAAASFRNVVAGTNIVRTLDPATSLSTRGVQIVGDTAMVTANDNACIHAYADSRL